MVFVLGLNPTQFIFVSTIQGTPKKAPKKASLLFDGQIIKKTKLFELIPTKSYHGNPQPSFLGVITHILGV